MATLACWLTLAGCGVGEDLRTVPTTAPLAATPTLVPTLPTQTSPPAPATATALPSTTPAPSPTPCQFALLLDLSVAWNAEEVGCPITPGAAAINTAYAPFEGGQMLWRGDTDVLYVLFHDGRWLSYPNTWREGDPEFTCGEASNPPTPVRGFGRVWCEEVGVREALGAVTAAEIGDDASAVQDYVNGTILRAPFGGVFVFEGEDGMWRLVEDLP
jgi:hypothetical protein